MRRQTDVRMLAYFIALSLRLRERVRACVLLVPRLESLNVRMRACVTPAVNIAATVMRKMLILCCSGNHACAELWFTGSVYV